MKAARSYAEEMSEKETQIALEYLEKANPRGAAGESMLELANMLLKRNQ